MRLVSVVLLIVMLLPAALVASDAPKVWVCPMPEHPQEFSKPGKCPQCGMQLVEKSKRLTVAILVFDGVEEIDYAAPYEVFGQAFARVFTVAPTTAVVHSVWGLRVQPEFDFENAPASNVLLIPGGDIHPTMNDEKVLQWIRQRAASAKYVLSVCNGAFIAAKAGLLDGLTATTTAGRIDELAAFAPKTHVVRERFVDNGKIITAAGLSAGIDGALHVLERQYGRMHAQEVARQIEYRWQPDLKWTRSTDAEMILPDVGLPSDASWEKLYSNGDAQRWELRGRLRIPMTSDEFLDYSTKQIVANGWKLRDSDKGRRTFVRTDREGQTWQTTFVITPDGAPATFLETMSVRRIATAK